MAPHYINTNPLLDFLITATRLRLTAWATRA
jgi:hypothetical protein